MTLLFLDQCSRKNPMWENWCSYLSVFLLSNFRVQSGCQIRLIQQKISLAVVPLSLRQMSWLKPRINLPTAPQLQSAPETPASARNPRYQLPPLGLALSCTILTTVPHQLHSATFPQPPKPQQPEGESSWALRNPSTNNSPSSANCVSPPSFCVALCESPLASTLPLLGSPLMTQALHHPSLVAALLETTSFT